MNYDIKASGLRIKKLRIDAQLTTDELANKLSISVRQLRRIERGDSGGSIDLLVEVSKIFNVSLDYVVLGRLSNNTDAKKVLNDAIKLLISFEKQL